MIQKLTHQVSHANNRLFCYSWYSVESRHRAGVQTVDQELHDRNCRAET